MKNRKKAYNKARTPEMNKEMNAKSKKVTNERMKEYNRRKYLKKRDMKKDVRKPAGVEKLLDLDDLLGVPKKRQKKKAPQQ